MSYLSVFPHGLSIGRKVMMELRINGSVEETATLEFFGYVGKEGWLHFVNPRTQENHLIKRDDFPTCTFLMGRENVCKIRYYF